MHHTDLETVQLVGVYGIVFTHCFKTLRGNKMYELR